ncbi:MAG: YciI family protein [Betaproteobacteria bacterium]
MLYVIFGEDVANSAEKRAAARPAHLARVQEMADAGRMVLAGPLPNIDSPDPGPAGMGGSLLVVELESLEAAQAWIADDPYVTQGVFERVTVRPFKQVFPA